MGLIGTIAKDLNSQGPSYPFEFVKPVLARADFVFGNLEIPIADVQFKRTSEYLAPNMVAPKGAVEALKEANFSVLSLANNHIMDYGAEGLSFTQRLLGQAGINFVGAGKDISEARKPLIEEKRGLKIGFLAYAMKGPHSAGPNRAGAAPIEEALIEDDIRMLSERVDFIVVSLHFGKIYTDYPTRQDQVLARQIIDLGASAVIGHHPHVLQGVEAYHEGYIVYSLGEFIFDPTVGNVYARKMQHLRKECAIVLLRFNNSKSQFEIIPARLREDCRPEISHGAKRQVILGRIDDLSRPLQDYDVDFLEHLASRSVEHNLNVLTYHLRSRNFRYLLSRMLRIRPHHLRACFLYLGRLFPGKRN
jgi:poly-gamma-glutamate synthesis protein (capsule biosynthesis protein)